MCRTVTTLGVVLLCLWFGLLSLDLLSALSAQSCPGSSGCYPWRAEGSVGGRWSYESKSGNLASAFVQAVLVAVAALFLGLKSYREKALSAIKIGGVLAVVGAAAFLTLL